MARRRRSSLSSSRKHRRGRRRKHTGSLKSCAGVKRNGQLKRGYRWRRGTSGACPVKVK